MAYVPVTFTKDGQTEVAETIGEYVELQFDGWTPGPPAPVRSALSDDQEASALTAAAESAAWARDPDLLVVGAITRVSGMVTTAQVIWPDGAAGVLTVLGRDANGAVLSYQITRVVAGVTTTYTQPTITRDSSGNATNVPQITVA